MTKRDFFRVIIKLFGLYALIMTIFNYIPTNISFITLQFEPITLLWILGAFVFIILIYVLLILKTDVIVDFLKLDKGFDDQRIEFGNFNSENILKLAMIIIGGLLILDYLPVFLQYTYLAFKNEVAPKGLNYVEEALFGRPSDYFNWVIAGLNILIGIILLTNYVSLAKWLNRRNQSQ